MRHRLIGLEGREKTIEMLKTCALGQLQEIDSEISVLAAESGVGKSSVMSGLVRELEALNAPNLVVVYHFVGCSNSSNYVEK